jgi:anti-sigma factor RsiW
MSPELDAKLSALLDDELPAEEAAALRAEIARRPELAARLAELAAVDAELRALPERPLPADLRARLGARIHAERTTSARSAPPPRRRRWIPAAALAAAAALALVVLPRLRTEPGTEIAHREPEPTPEAVARTAPEATPEVVARTTPEATPEVVARSTPEATPEVVARSTPEPAPEVVVRSTPPAVVAEGQPEADLERLAQDLLEPGATTAGELYEDDLPVIAVLDVLAELDELEGAG